MSEPKEGRESRSTVLLIAGALLGALLAASGLFETVNLPSSDEVIAEVNEWSISREDFDAALAVLENSKRGALTASDQAQLLDRMIEEKLLLQRGLELGLLESDPSVRKAVSSAMIQTVIAEVSALQPEEDDLLEFYKTNSAYFSAPARLRVQQLVFLDKGNAELALKRALAAIEAMERGSDFISVRRDLADPQVLKIPNTLLPPHKLRDYIGPSLLEHAFTLQTGELGTPQRVQNGYAVLLMLENEPQKNQAIDSVRERLVSEYQRRAGDTALREYLDMLRAEADVRVAKDAFAEPAAK